MSQVDSKTHYDFGKNWARFAEDVAERNAAEAVKGLSRLIGDNLKGKSFLDIGCGSGLHAVAALRLGAATVRAVDLDPNSVSTARHLLTRFAAGEPWHVEERSVFELSAASGRYDVVYAWGVLHHTGRMRDAIRHAASLVEPGGLLVIAIYRKTPLCPAWRLEKKFYALGPRWYRSIADFCLAALTLAALAMTGRNPVAYVRQYPRARGMTFMTNIRDWLGGYPYESASPEEIRSIVAPSGFREERFFPCNTRVGLLGVGCDEYVFRTQATADAR